MEPQRHRVIRRKEGVVRDRPLNIYPLPKYIRCPEIAIAHLIYIRCQLSSDRMND
ncbi:hypothetical protein H6G72_11955 [Planktothricoides sp. FACHB-1370]|uniref:Uncharacterized protein n=1 Tax=Planktothricoides raciborskii FACHB-1370 TaxID=2949576 RepID=A0ABR8ECU9_9CYAN|nr:hypothetical protein [Planktothricoides raciborskii]MBD2544538.1 hypothetical protein [Planktothricoides raciborskii FACHB-1370]MBD2585544.1 hypothetical protein [Planktothricoides raciborskii FACHB-1261]